VVSKTWQGWERTRARGERFFVWVNGVLGWGVPMALLWTFYHGWYEQKDNGLYVTAAIAFPIFTVGGYLWGKYMWRFLERRYQKAQAKAAVQGA
jgi:hypothetical protein